MFPRKMIHTNRNRICNRISTNASLSSFVTIKCDDANGKPPRAVVLVLGFGGAQPRHVAKYAQLYTAKGCSAVWGTASNYDTFLNHKGLEIFAKDAVQQVTKLIREDNDAPAQSLKEKTPIVIHILSNGGAFVVRSINHMLDARDRKRNEMHDDLELFANRLKMGCQIFDSAPCYLDMNSSFNVIKHLIPNPLVGIPAAALFTALSGISYIVPMITGKPTPGEMFWTDLLEATSCNRHGFIYTEKDDIANSKKIEEFISERKKRGANIRVKHFEESTHVQHLRLHGQEYSNFVETLLTDMEEGNKERKK